MKISGKFIVKVAGTLTVIAVVVAGLLGVTNQFTAPNIAATNKAKTEAALAEVVTADDAEFVPLEDADVEKAGAAASGMSGKVAEAYAVKVGGEDSGYAFKIVAGGSQGDIEMVVGVDADLAVTGVSIVKSSETSGIGSKVMDNQPSSSGTPVLDQFVGKSGAGSLVVKDNIDAITGATVSTKGVTKGVNAALAAAEALA